MIDPEWAGAIASVITVFAYIPYISSILRGETRPHLITWVVWSVLGAVLTASYYAAGATVAAIIVPALNVLGPVIISCLAIKYGEIGYQLFDVICFITALCGLIGWSVTGNPLFALYICLIVDFSGALPTIKKVAEDQSSENRPAWLLFLAANSINLCTIPEYRFELMAYPLYLFALPLIVTFFLYRQKATI